MNRVLGTVLVSATLVLAGCAGGSDTNTPNQPEIEDVEKATEETTQPVATPEPTEVEETTHVAGEATTVQPSSQASAVSTNTAFNCRILTHVAAEDMSEAEAAALSTEIANRMAEDIEAGEYKDMGDVMDKMGVPAYEETCG